MALAFQNGGLVAASGALGQHPACCCKPPPPNSGPACGCSLFSRCTTSVTYDGHVYAFQSSGGGGGSGLIGRVAGTQTYQNMGFPNVLRPIGLVRDFLVTGCNLRGPVQRLFQNDCGSGSPSIQHHFLVYVANVRFTVGFGLTFQSLPQQIFAYRYELDLPSSASCPASLAGRIVSVRQVAELGNQCNNTCAAVLDWVKSLFLPFQAFHYPQGSYQVNPFAWGVDWFNPANQQPVADDSWFCAHPVWQSVTPPSVSIACAP